MPVRACAPIDGALRIHRDFAFGDLLHLAVLDDRQYRSPIAVGAGAGNLPRFFGGGPQLPEAFDESRTMLGAEQERWLRSTFARARRARWTVLGQQTVMAEVDRAPGDPARGFSMDAWDGYVAARNRLLRDVRNAGLRNFVCVGGDIHTSCVTDLLADYHDAAARRVGTELVAPSISAIELLDESLAEATLQNPHIHLYDIQRRGYLRCELSRDACRADYRWVTTTASPSAQLEPGPSWMIADGSPGAHRV
jgi:alkaline phosphatase D